MGVSENFNYFLNQIKISDETKQKILSRKNSITKRINKDFRGTESYQYSRFVGSYGRNTAIKGISDVDLLIELPYSVYTRFNNYLYNGQSSLLQEVRKSISVTYSETKMGGDGQVVVVEYYDMTFEVLPTFIQADGSYLFPDSNDGGKWRICKPIQEIEAIDSMDRLYNGKVKDLVRMMKVWKEINKVKISGMLIETLVMNFMRDWIYNTESYHYYDFMVRDFLHYLSNLNPDQRFWRAWGSDQYVWCVEPFNRKAKESYEIAYEASNDELNGYKFLAAENWQKIFGNKYKGLTV